MSGEFKKQIEQERKQIQIRERIFTPLRGFGPLNKTQ